MRFEDPLQPSDSPAIAIPMEWIPVPEKENTHQELLALEAQYKSLQTLVSELLVTNQQLRTKIAKLKLQDPAAACPYLQS
jgi:hypothetical protein